jgi:hypothetical protein
MNWPLPLYVARKRLQTEAADRARRARIVAFADRALEQLEWDVLRDDAAAARRETDVEKTAA